MAQLFSNLGKKVIFLAYLTQTLQVFSKLMVSKNSYCTTVRAKSEEGEIHAKQPIDLALVLQRTRPD